MILTEVAPLSGIAKRGKTGWSRLARQLLRSALGLGAFALASSVLATPKRAMQEGPVQREPQDPRVAVVLVALDGVRWQEVFEGADPNFSRAPHASARPADLMPRLHDLIRTSGAAVGAPESGSPILASGPEFVSLPGYSEMLTGRRITGCRDND